MKLTGSRKNGSGKRKSTEQSARIKTFPGEFIHSPAGENPAVRPGTRVPERPHEPAGVWEPVTADAPQPSVELQDTLWTEDRFTIRFTDENGVILQCSEVSYGEKPVYREETPVKAADERFAYLFAGWSPEIVRATADATYTALFSARPRLRQEEKHFPPDRKTGPVDPEAHTAPVQEEETEPASYIPEADYEPEDGQYLSPESYFSPETDPDPADEDDPLSGTSPVPAEEDHCLTGTEPESSCGGDSVPEEEYGSLGEDMLFPEVETDTGEEETDSVEEEDPVFPGVDVPGPEDESVPEAAMPSGSGNLLLPQLAAVGKTSLLLSWQPLPDADGYDVFFAQSGTDFEGIFCTVPSDETSCVFDSLEKKTVWKARVKAFSLAGGQKEYRDSSYVLHCITGGSTKKYTNALEISITDARPELEAGSKLKIGASVIGPEDKQVLTRGHALRYLSEDPGVASVSAKGKIKGISEGCCRIWLIAPNGIHSALEVSVRARHETLSFKKKKYTLKTGEEIDLRKKLRSVPALEYDSLKWKSSDSSVAQVSENGIVKALSGGRTGIRVKNPAGARAKVRICVNAGKKASSVPWESVGKR